MLQNEICILIPVLRLEHGVIFGKFELDIYSGSLDLNRAFVVQYPVYQK